MPVPLRLAAWFPAGAGRPAGGRHFCLPGGRSGRGGRAPAPRYNVLARHSETGARRASRRDRPITRPQEGSRGAKAGIQADAPETPPGPMSRAAIQRPFRPARWTCAVKKAPTARDSSARFAGPGTGGDSEGKGQAGMPCCAAGQPVPPRLAAWFPAGAGCRTPETETETTPC